MCEFVSSNIKNKVNFFESETEFKVEIKVKNLIDKEILLVFNKQNSSKETLEMSQNSEVEFGVYLNKFEFVNCFCNNTFNDEHLISDLINQKLNIQYSVDKHTSYDLKFEQKKLSENFKNSIFKMPVDWSFHLTLISNSEKFYLYSLALVAKSVHEYFFESVDHYFTFEILDRMKIKFLNGKKKWKLEVNYKILFQ